MKRSAAILVVTSMTVLAPAALAQTIDLNTLVWTTCGACPSGPEVVATGGTVRVGVAGRAEDNAQPTSRHMAAAQLPPAQSYTITFSYNLSSWDSYVAPGTPNPPFNGGTGYWDSFSLSLSAQPYWQLGLTDPITPAKLPGLGFIRGATSYGDHNVKPFIGTTTVTINGNGPNPVWLNVGLDTASSPSADSNFPSWGTFTITEIKTTCSGDIATIGGIPKYYQCGNPYKTPAAGTPGAWWAEAYGNGSHTLGTDGLMHPTICDAGCAMTAFAMLLSYHGFTYDPSTLNAKLKSMGNAGYVGALINFNSVSFLTGNALEYKVTNTAQVVDAELCAGRPVILQVPGHFVLATGKTGGEYTINDPGHINVTTLDYYGNTFTSARRFVPPGSGAFVIHADEGVQVLVTDPVGRRVGFSPSGIVKEVVESYYGDQSLTEDDPFSGADYSSSNTRFLFIPSPAEGFYQIQIIGVTPGPAGVVVSRYNTENLPQTVQRYTVDLLPGSSVTRTVPYSTKKGDVNGDGFVDDDDLAIVQASIGAKLGDPDYEPAADLNGDGIINVYDVAIITNQPPETVDAVAPTSSAVPSEAPNGNGWNRADLTVSISAVDNPGGSGVKQITYSVAGAQTVPLTTVLGSGAAVSITTEGVSVITYFAVDNFGNVEAAKTVTVALDKTPPAIAGLRTPAGNAFGWNASPVTVTFDCADSLSGLTPGSPPSPVVLSAQGANHSATGSCSDMAGNAASVTVSDINIDATPPTITARVSTATLWPPNGKLAPVQLTGLIQDGLSGIDASTITFRVVDEYGALKPSGTLTLNVAGEYSVTLMLESRRLGQDADGRSYQLIVSGTDKAGNVMATSALVIVPHDQRN